MQLIVCTLVLIACLAASTQSITAVDQRQEQLPSSKDGSLKWRDSSTNSAARLLPINLHPNGTVVTPRNIDKNWTLPIKAPPSGSNPPEEYETAFEKGMCILENVYRGGIEAGNWLQWSQLTDGGWTQASSRPINAAAWLTVLLQTERWSLSDFTEFTFNYPQPWIPGSWLATYSLLVNTKAGVIIVETAFAPKQPYTDPRQPPQSPPAKPLLARLSDFTFLVWKQACIKNDDRGIDECMLGLQWVIHDMVVELSTTQVVRYALSNANQQLKPWRGTPFPTNKPSGITLVGSPNGWGIAYMIAQYPIYFGGLTIDNVVVFESDTLNTDIAFHITKLPENELPPGWR
ncbi:hypothetical protein MMC10_003673 [Thelotrema lepadinum]|nr:hypothetical protein [Thelotrema lepadinum]